MVTIVAMDIAGEINTSIEQTSDSFLGNEKVLYQKLLCTGCLLFHKTKTLYFIACKFWGNPELWDPVTSVHKSWS